MTLFSCITFRFDWSSPSREPEPRWSRRLSSPLLPSHQGLPDVWREDRAEAQVYRHVLYLTRKQHQKSLGNWSCCLQLTAIDVLYVQTLYVYCVLYVHPHNNCGHIKIYDTACASILICQCQLLVCMYVYKYCIIMSVCVLYPTHWETRSALIRLTMVICNPSSSLY